MSSFFILASLSTLFGLVLCTAQRWAYVCLAVSIEISWVSLVLLYGLFAVEFDDGSFMFWCLVWLFVSAVELCVCLFGFVVMAELRRTSYV